METLKETGRKLLANGDVRVVIGYREGSNGSVRPAFARNDAELSGLIYDSRCIHNLAMYLYKKETANLGKPAVVANIHTLRGIIRLASEKQINDGDLIALYVNGNEVVECRTFDEIENCLSSVNPQLKDDDRLMLDKLDAMTSKERWDFWQNEMVNCIRCYACRQACPLCYCTQCTVEMNQPQWIPVAANRVGNLEWHIMRAMHLAGRCIECGQCGEACPVGIPIHLLPFKIAGEMKKMYGSTTGMKRDEGCDMASFKPDDKENFIK